MSVQCFLCVFFLHVFPPFQTQSSSIGISSNRLQGAKYAMEVNHRLQSTIHCGLCDAKPTTLKRPSPGDGFVSHMYCTKFTLGIVSTLCLNNSPLLKIVMFY